MINVKEPDQVIKGVTEISKPDGSVEITHRRTGELIDIIFLTVWLGGWSIVCVWILAGLITDGVKGPAAPVWFVMLFCGVWLLFFWKLLYMRFSIKTITLRTERLKLESQLLGYRTEQIYRLRDIREITLYEPNDDHGRWNLMLMTVKKHNLITDQSFSSLKWIGEQLCVWHGSELLIESARQRFKN